MSVLTMMDFDSVLIESIDGTISSILGRGILESAYRFIAKDCGITKERIPDRLDEFDDALVKMFGVGGTTIGRAIARRLYAQLGLEFIPHHGKRLVDYVEDAKARLS
jgi:hypothetical protein